jgi:RND family efflux transporter MFP subunit
MTRSLHHTRHARQRILGLVSVVVLQLSACNATAGDEGGATDALEPAGGAITIWTDSTELFMEHPALIVGAPDKFAVHLTDITDYEPLRSGRITLTFVPTDGGQSVVVIQDEPRAPGIYGPSPAFEVAGVYDLTIVVESPQAHDRIVVPGLRVYPNVEAAPKDSGGGESGISFLKEQQWKTPGFRTAFARTGSVNESFDVTGQVQSAAGHYAEVAAPIGAFVSASGNSQSPVPGQRVRAGDVLVHITPSLGEGGSALAAARASLQEATDELARAKRLVAVEAIPARRLHEAEIRLQAAREALTGLSGGQLSESGTLAVRAPISGVITSRTITPGARVDAGTVLFTIVDPSLVWLQVHVPAAQVNAVNRSSGADFTVEGSTRRYATRRTLSVGQVIDPLSRTVPVLFDVTNSDGSLRIGATARASLRTGKRVTGVLIPTDAVLDEDGRAIVYVQIGGELFEKRSVVIGGRDATFAVVTSGIAEGERVVTGAAYQVRLASLSTSVPAQGHEH